MPLNTVEECIVRQLMVRVHDSEWEIVDYDDEIHSLFQDYPNIHFDQLSCILGKGLKVPKTKNFWTNKTDMKLSSQMGSAFGKKIVLSSEKNSFTLYITDTGGQPEFQEYLPAFFSGPSIFLLFFRLDKDIREKYSVDPKYSSGQGVTGFHYHASSTKDYLLQALTTIASTFQTNCLPVRPQVFFVGTHQELISEEEVSKIDYELQQLIKPILFDKKGLVQFASENRLILEFNSTLGMGSAITRIRSHVKHLSTREDFNCSVPRSWLMLDLILRQSRAQAPILSFNECFEVAKECGIGTHNDLEEALLFLSERIGSVKHQSLGDSESIVLTDLQYIFDKITNLFHYSLPPDALAVNRGIVPLDGLQKYALTEKLHSTTFLRLLESLHLAHSIAVEDDSLPKYFIPCCLSWTSLENASEMHSKESHNLPLMIHFDYGFIPRGFFGGLVACMVGNSVQSSLDWKLKDEQAFQNCIKFCVKSMLETSTVTLVTHLSDIEVKIIKSFSKSHNLPDKSLFTEVHRCLEKCCEAVLQSLNLRNTTKYSFGFSCPGIGMKDETRPHAAVIEFHQGQVDKLVCVHTGKIWDAPQECKLWFGQVRLALNVSYMPTKQ